MATCLTVTQHQRCEVIFRQQVLELENVTTGTDRKELSQSAAARLEYGTRHQKTERAERGVGKSRPLSLSFACFVWVTHNNRSL